MSRPTVLMLLALTLPMAAHAELRTYLEPRLVDEMDTIRLTIRSDGSSQSESPDLTPLMKDFEVLGNQTSSRITSINGRTQASVEYQITLRPRRTGELTVPRLKFGNDYSDEIRVAVRPLDPVLKQTIESMVFFETDVSKNPVYVQAETVLIRRLFYSQGVQIYSDLPGVPEVENAVVIPLGETQSRSVMRGGQRYGVIEQRFAIFPEQSGPLVIPAISVTSSVRLQTGGRTRRSGIRVSTEPVNLEVLPIPAEYPADAPWLPATEVTATQVWEPQTRTIHVGEPLRFGVHVSATGNRGSAIPPVPLPLPPDQFKIYPEAPVMEESADSGTVVGHRSVEYALIPTAPGDVSLAPLSITWWNTATDRLMTTEIAVDPITVTGVATPTPETPALEAGASEEATAPETTPVDLSRTAVIAAGALLALGVLLVVGVALSRVRLHWPVSTRRRAPQPDRRKTYAALRQAARQKDLETFRHRLVDYLVAAYDVTAASALDRFRVYPEAGAALAELDRAMYAREGAAAPDLDKLTLLAHAATTGPRTRAARGELPPLYA